MICSARRYLAPYGLEEVELQHEGHKLDAAGTLYIPLRENKRLNPITPSLLSIDTPGDKRNLPVESRFEDALKRERSEVAEGERIGEALSEVGEDTGVTTAGTTAAETYSPGTTRELLQHLSEDEWAKIVGSPRKNLELQLGRQSAKMDTVFLSNEASKRTPSKKKIHRFWKLWIRRNERRSC